MASSVMKFLGTAFLHGLATLLPVALTVYLVYLMAVTSEDVMGGLLRLVIPPEMYWPGLGVVFTVIAITALGLLVRIRLLGFMFNLSDALLSRIPLVKTVYSTIRDLMSFVAATQDKGDTGQPVLVRLFDGVELVGLVTDANPALGDRDNRSLVYLPMSYQLGGYTLSLDKDRLEPLSMSMEDAMRFVVTAGVKAKAKTTPDKGDPS